MSLTSVDFPEPLTPVTATKTPSGILTSIPFRLCSVAFLTTSAFRLETFRRLARMLPADALWVTSHLRRTQETARSITAHMPEGAAPAPLVEPDLAEQNFGDWQGLTHEELAARRDGAWHRFWLTPAAEAPPGGESFVQVIERVSAVIARLSRAHAGRDVVAVCHGGTIRAALALALDLDPDKRPPVRIVKERRATFAQTPQALRRRAPARTKWRNLVLAGDWTDTGFPATIESAVRSGRAAAGIVTEN